MNTTALDKYVFQKIINDKNLLNEFTYEIFPPGQEALIKAYKFIKMYYDDWIKGPSKALFIELIAQHGVSEEWSNDQINLMFDYTFDINKELLDEGFQKKAIIHKTRLALTNATIEYKTFLEADYINTPVEGLQERAKKIMNGLIKSIETSSSKNKIKVFNLSDFPSMDWPINEPLKCGYPLFDNYQLIKRGCITTILGATSSRKSTFLLNIAHRLIKHNYKILYLIIEGNISRNVQSLVAQINSIAMKDVSANHFQNDYTKNVSVAFQNYAMIKVDDINELFRGTNYDAIILDYVTLLNEDEESTFLKGQVISQKLKNMAEKYNVAIVTAAQTNRNGMNKIILDAEDVGESHGITMAMDVMLGIIKYKKLENDCITGLEIIKIRDIPDEMAFEPAEGKREFYKIHFTNKALEPISDQLNKLSKMVDADIDSASNDKRSLNTLEKDLNKEEIKATKIDPSLSKEQEIKRLFDN